MHHHGGGDALRCAAPAERVPTTACTSRLGAAARPSSADNLPSHAWAAGPEGGGVGGGGMGGGMAGLGGMLPAMSALGYGPRVVSKTLPIDPNDTSSFSINIPQVYYTIRTHSLPAYMYLPLYVLEPRSTPPHTLTAGCQGHHQASSRGVQADQRPGWWGAGSARQASH